MTGAGYDQDCDGVYDEDTDVLPFIASVDDPFGGVGGEAWDLATVGGGMLGGMGFRDGSLPVLVYSTSTFLRDPEADYGSPNGCPLDAGFSDVVDGMAALGARLVGVAAQSSIPEAQLRALAEATGSVADSDGDGQSDDPLVFMWSGPDSDFREGVTAAVTDLVTTTSFREARLEVVGDERGFIAEVPATTADVGLLDGGRLAFTLTVSDVVSPTTDDQAFPLKLNLVSGASVLLGSRRQCSEPPRRGGAPRHQCHDPWPASGLDPRPGP